MASSGFPQIPSTVWRGVWQLINKAPTRKLDARTLAADLGVQTTAAKQYLKELHKLGILDADGKPAEIADAWRQDPNDPKIISRILENAYPESLRQLAPPNDLDREKVVRWFQGERLGIGASKNKAATYLLVASGMPEEPLPSVSAPKRKRTRATEPPADRAKPPDLMKPAQRDRSTSRAPQLAVNVQVHISADATSEQIDAIFSAMRQYFDASEAS